MANQLKSFYRTLLIPLGYLVLVYLLFLLIFILLQDRYLYKPPRLIKPLIAQSFFIPTPAGRINAIFLKHPHAKATLLYSHGNASDLHNIMPLLHQIDQRGYSVFSYDYNGYGRSAGQPSEQNCYTSAAASYRYLHVRLHIPPQQLILIGHSLGAAITVELGLHHHYAGMILQSPFLSAYRVALLHGWPLLPFSPFNSAAKINRLHGPLLIIHGTHDKVIPFFHGVQLFQMARSPKFFQAIAGADHNHLQTAQYWSAINRLIAVATQIKHNNTHNLAIVRPLPQKNIDI